METTLLDFKKHGSLGNFELNDFSISHYNSINLSEIRTYLDSLPEEYFHYVKNNEGDTIEKIIHDYYMTDDYYDLILFLNNRDMLFDMPYSYDVILNAISSDVQNYAYKVFGNIKQSLSETSTNKIKEKLDSEYSSKNQSFLYLKVIKFQYINEVIKAIYDILERQRDMYSLLEE